MKTIFKFVQKNLGEIFALTGSVLSSYNLLGIGYRKIYTGDFVKEYRDIGYFYSNETKFYFALGIFLLIFGVLILRKK